MDWDKRNYQLQFYKDYLTYLSKASNALTEDKVQELCQPLKFTKNEKSALACVLMQTICKLNIVNRCNIVDNSRIATLLTEQVPMNIRFKKENLDKLYDERTLQPLCECFKAMANSKLENDIETIRYLLQIYNTEFQTIGQFQEFIRFCHSVNRESCDEYTLLKTFNANKNLLNELSEQLKMTRQKTQKTIEQLNNKLFQLKTECDESKIKHTMENNMVTKWEQTRHAQIESVFKNEHSNLDESCKSFEHKTERELITINELTNFYRLKCEKLENSMAYWERRFASEKQELDQEIHITQATIEDVQSKYELINNWYEKREEFMKNYWIEQNLLEERRQLEAKQCRAAIHIQSWWRGTMVRKQLGPYRAKKKCKKNTKNGKKK